MLKMMIIGVSAITIIGLIGLGIVDNASAQYGYYPPKKEPTASMDHQIMNYTSMDTSKTTTENSDHTTMKYSNMADMVTGHKLPPIKQISAGVLPKDIQCNDGFVLIFSPSNNPGCVRTTTMEVLTKRGWTESENAMASPVSASNEQRTVDISAKEINEIYRWTNSDGVNPTIVLDKNSKVTFNIENPTDAKHEFVIESDGKELAASGDISPDGSVNMNFDASSTGVFEYHCEYHPTTMKGTIQVK